jgi:carboxyl-terminal processing protease
MRAFLLILSTIILLAFVPNWQSNKYFEMMKNIEIFTNLYKELNTHYVEDIDPGKLMRIGLDAMVSSLDPYTNYISESDIEGFRIMSEGRHTGIGTVTRKIGNSITIVEIFENLSADVAGLLVGDQIIEIDGRTTEGKSEEDVSDILRGFPGTSVQITIKRPGVSDPFSVSLQRSEVTVPNVPYSGMLNEEIGYVILTTFTQRAGGNVSDAIKKLKEDHPNIKGVVLDLRGNGGGLLHEAVNVCNAFIPSNQVVVTTKGRLKESDRAFNTMSPPLDIQIPLAVLIDNYSASASEIVSGVIQDYDRGVLIGQQSYGKGLVQNTRDIGYNAKVKLTTAKYYIPSGRCIQSVAYENGEPIAVPDSLRGTFKTKNQRIVMDGGGVKPDIEIPHPGQIPIIKNLLDRHLIFEYVHQFASQNPSIPPVEEFKFSSYEDFLKFLKDKNFRFESESEKLLSSLNAQLKEEGIQGESEMNALKSKLSELQTRALLQYKDLIVPLIEKEIAARYYYQNGKIRMALRNDLEISEAIRILQNQIEYNKILNN